MDPPKRHRAGPVAWLLIQGIRLYQVSLAMVIGGQCRFEPSCSVYGIEALRRYGAIRGGYLAVRRILRCHPWGGSGSDPVP